MAADLVEQLLAAGASPSEPEDNALLQPLHLACMGEVTHEHEVRMQLPGGDQLHALLVCGMHLKGLDYSGRCTGQLPAGMCAEKTVRGVARTTPVASCALPHGAAAAAGVECLSLVGSARVASPRCDTWCGCACAAAWLQFYELLEMCCDIESFKQYVSSCGSACGQLVALLLNHGACPDAPAGLPCSDLEGLAPLHILSFWNGGEGKCVKRQSQPSAHTRFEA